MASECTVPSAGIVSLKMLKKCQFSFCPMPNSLRTDKQMENCFLLNLVELPLNKLTLVFDGIIQIKVLTH